MPSGIVQGAWLVNTARGAICDKDAVAAALKSGQIRGYAGDVWNVQPAPKDHIWRTMKNALGGGNGMVPHYSGTTLDAQSRYANGTKSILENYLTGKPQEPQNIIVGLGMFDAIHPLYTLLTSFFFFSRQIRVQSLYVFPIHSTQTELIESDFNRWSTLNVSNLHSGPQGVRRLVPCTPLCCRIISVPLESIRYCPTQRYVNYTADISCSECCFNSDREGMSPGIPYNMTTMISVVAARGYHKCSFPACAVLAMVAV